MSDSVDSKLNVAAWIFVLMAFVVGVQGIADGLPMHGFDKTWPDHARFHVTWATANKVGFCLTAAIVALIPLRRRERWSWWVLLIFTVLGNYALIPSAIWQGSGPRAGFEIPIAVGFLALLIALVLSFRVGFPKKAAT